MADRDNTPRKFPVSAVVLIRSILVTWEPSLTRGKVASNLREPGNHTMPGERQRRRMGCANIAALAGLHEPRETATRVDEQGLDAALAECRKVMRRDRFDSDAHRRNPERCNRMQIAPLCLGGQGVTALPRQGLRTPNISRKKSAPPTQVDGALR